MGIAVETINFRYGNVMNAVVGIDIGGTYTKFGIVDKKGQCLGMKTIATGQFPDVRQFQESLFHEINSLMDALGKDIKIKGIGIGAPNGNYYDGTIKHAPNMKWKGIVPFVKKFKKFYPDIPIVLTNDANAAALGEMIYGSAKNMKNFVVVTLGTGLGSAFVVNGQLVYGSNGLAGELGHVNVEQKGRICRCGNKGCLETYVSANGIKLTFLNLLSEKSNKSILRKMDFNELTSKMICQAAKKGDPIALEAFAITGKILGRKLSDVVAITNPEAIFIMGGLADAGKLILHPVRKYLEKSLFHVFRGTVKILPSKLKGENAAVLGAGALAWRELG